MYRKYMKRAFDVIGAIVGMVLLSPVLLAAAIAIKLSSPGNIIFKQVRLGKDQKAFEIYKFRSMVQNAEKLGPNSTRENDNRITQVGRFLRKTSIDELPQLLNVLLGHMSFVGPRPHLYVMVDESDLTHDIYIKRFSVKPGITGMAQANGRSLLTPQKRDELDAYYVDHLSFMLDIVIILKTAQSVLFQRGTN